MAQEGSEASVASSSPALNWWEMSTINPMVSWNAMNNNNNNSRWPDQHTHSSNSCEEDISISTNSFTNASTHSVAAAGDHNDNHLWNQVLLGVGSSSAGGMHRSSHDEGDKFLEVLSCKNLITTNHMFDPACDYLKKLDSSWEFTSNSSSLNALEKHLNSGYNGSGDLIDSERLTSNLSDLVSNWSIAPPNPHIDHHQISPSGCNVSMDPNSMAYTKYSHVSHMKHEAPGSPNSFPNFQSYVHEVMKGHDHNQRNEMGDFSYDAAGLGSHIGLNNSVIGLNNSGLMMGDTPWSIPRNLSDLISFSSLNKPCIKSSVSSETSKKAGHESYSSTKGSGRGSGTTSEGKKKRIDQYSSETLFKKPKHESSPLKLQVPKIKVADKITALQQIVSPFGKTDTASVLLEAINYIRFLQEQVQLLSDPYLKSSANKDHSSWGSVDRKEKAESKLDLRSRGLCLVPISFTPQAYRENTGPDYWTPPYRGCLYR